MNASNTKRLFGTDGIRTRAGKFPLNASCVVAIGQAIGEKLAGSLLVGQDTRISSPWILKLLREGLQRSGKASIEDAGVIPTPAIALLTRAHHFSGGIMISASHNPFEDNGIKVFSPDGTKLTDKVESEIADRILALLPEGTESITDVVPEPSPQEMGHSPWPRRYQELLLSHFGQGRRQEKWLSGFRVLMDCANGAMSSVAPGLMRDLGAEVNVICGNPTGRNINENCGAVHLGTLAAAMRDARADMGVAFDGDGDRSLFVSPSGKHIDGDAVLMVMARRMKYSTVVGTSMTNYALEKMLREEGVRLTRVDVGDRYIFEQMQRTENAIGGEPSGHIIFPDFRLSGDGLLTTLKLAEAMVDSKQSLDDLTKDWVAAPQLLKGARVTRRIPIEELAALRSTMQSANAVLENRGRLVVRYSGTEALLRVMIESDDANLNEEWMKKLLAAIEKDFAQS